MNTARLVLLLAILVTAIAGPLLAYSMYPGSIPASTEVEERPPSPELLFVKALRHSHYYRGFRGVAGVVVAAFPHGVIVHGAHGEKIVVVLPRCLLVGGRPLPLSLVADKLIGKHVVVAGHVFTAPHGLVVKPRLIRVDGFLLVVRPCHPRHAPIPHHGGLRNH